MMTEPTSTAIAEDSLGALVDLARYPIDNPNDLVRAGHGEDEGVTCPYCPENDVLHDMRLDYVYVSADLAGRVCAARIDDDAQGSDHQPVWVGLEL